MAEGHLIYISVFGHTAQRPRTRRREQWQPLVTNKMALSERNVSFCGAHKKATLNFCMRYSAMKKS